MLSRRCATGRRLISWRTRRNGGRATSRKRRPCATPSTRWGRFVSTCMAISTWALNECRDELNAIRVDRTRVKPIVKVTGEFWAQTTEGDGNFNMFKFLESEGAQVLVEPIGTWICYMMSPGKSRSQAQVAGRPARTAARSGRGAKASRQSDGAAQEAGGIAVVERIWSITTTIA